MTVYNNAFDSYQLFIYSGPSSYSAALQLDQAGVFQGRIAFIPEGTALPPNGTISPLGTAVPSIFYHMSTFNDIITTLREETPLYLF